MAYINLRHSSRTVTAHRINTSLNARQLPHKMFRSKMYRVNQRINLAYGISTHANSLMYDAYVWNNEWK